MRKKRKHEKKNFRVFVFLANAIWQIFGKQVIRKKRLVFMQTAKRLYKKLNNYPKLTLNYTLR